MTAYSVLILQILLLLLLLPRALLQARVARCCKQALLAAAAWCCCCCCKRAYHRRQGSDLRSYDALFITVEPCLGHCCGAETALLAWWLGDTKTTGCQVGLAAENLEQEPFLIFSFHLVVLLGRGRRGQRKNAGTDSSGCRSAHKIDRTSACWWFLLLVASAAFYCCMPRLLPLLPLLQVGLAAARLRSSRK